MSSPTRRKRLPRLKGPKRRSVRLEGHRTPQVLQGESSELDAWAARLGSTSEARRMLTLKERFPQATLPELVTMDWLMRNGYTYEFQVPMLGGRSVKGGTVLDFVVYEGGNALAWAVQGEYFHTKRNIALRDKAQWERLLGMEIAGFRISAVVPLWEDDVYYKRPMIFYQALAGRGLRN